MTDQERGDPPLAGYAGSPRVTRKAMALKAFEEHA